ncbi:hypothetical protein [Kitasatospora cineracea]|uniref:hypothetical protein n=1 Tax=Kitasatospora cineracea TaxID=88074 RepID=UPI0038021245
MASVRRTASPARPRAVRPVRAAARAAAVLLLAVAALAAGPAVRPAVAAVPAAVPAAAATAPLARSEDGGDAVRNGMLLSLGSVLLLTGAACAVLYRRRPPSGR